MQNYGLKSWFGVFTRQILTRIAITGYISIGYKLFVNFKWEIWVYSGEAIMLNYAREAYGITYNIFRTLVMGHCKKVSNLVDGNAVILEPLTSDWRTYYEQKPTANIGNN